MPITTLDIEFVVRNMGCLTEWSEFGVVVEVASGNTGLSGVCPILRYKLPPAVSITALPALLKFYIRGRSVVLVNTYRGPT